MLSRQEALPGPQAANGSATWHLRNRCKNRDRSPLAEHAVRRLPEHDNGNEDEPGKDDGRDGKPDVEPDEGLEEAQVVAMQDQAARTVRPRNRPSALK